MRPRTQLLLTIAIGLLVFSFHTRLKKSPDYELVNRIADASSRPREWLGEYPPDVDVVLLDGSRFKLSDRVGKEVIVLNFFATWCAPCRAEMPELQRFKEAHKNDPVTLVGLDAREQTDVVRRFVSDLKLTFPIGIVQGDILKKYGVDSFPTTVVIGADGRVKLYELTAIANADVTLEPIIREDLQVIARGGGISGQDFLARSASEILPPVRVPGEDGGPTLTGRPLQIAQSMGCVCGCDDTLVDCTCGTAKKMKKKLHNADFGTKTDAEIKSELNAEFCMKGMS
jgi:thiol-disulfide isomerase/thioredoxin